MLDRRAFLRATAGAAVLAGLPGCGQDEERWERAAFARPATSRTAVLSVDGYRRGVEEAVRRGVELFGQVLDFRFEHGEPFVVGHAGLPSCSQRNVTCTG